MFRKRIIAYSLSIKVGNIDNYIIKVIYPCKDKKIEFVKLYGMTVPLTKTVLISNEIFTSGTPFLKDYVIAHEIGHLRDNRRMVRLFCASIFFTIFFVFGPFLFSHFVSSNILLKFIPIATFVWYMTTVGFNTHEKAELFADEYAVKVLGKEKCLSALNVLKSEKADNRTGFSKFFKPIPISRRIQFVNEYQEKEN